MSELSESPGSAESVDIQRNVELILDSAAEGIYGLDLEGRVTFVNAAAERLTGWPRTEQIGRDQHELIHHARADGTPCPRAECPIHATLRDGEIRRRSNDRFWRRDGTGFPVTYTCAPLRDEHGGMVGAVVTFSDISPQVEEQRYRSLIAASSDFVWRCDPDGGLVWISEAWLELTGLTLEEAKGYGWLPAVVDEDQEPYLQVWQRAVAETDVFEHEYRLRCPDGSIRWLFDRAVPVLDDSGAVLEWIGAGQDVTERREAEAELLRQRERYRTLVESTCAILWESEPDVPRFAFVSSEAEILLGYPLARWTDEPDFWANHLHPDDRERAMAQSRDVRTRPGAHEFEYRMIAADGHRIWLRDFVTVLTEGGRPHRLVGVMVDITAAKETELALEYVSGLQRNLVEIAGSLVAAGPDDRDGIFRDALRRVGEYCGVDRSYLLRVSPEFASMSSTHEWSAPGVDPLAIRDRPRRAAPELMRRMERRELIHVPRVEALGSDWKRERRNLCGQGVRSMILVPVVAGSQVEGYVGFDAVHEERAWSDDEIRLLRGLAEVLGATIQRDHADASRRESEALLKIAGGAARVGGWIADPEGRRITLSDEICAIHELPAGTSLTLREAVAYYAPEWRNRIRTLFHACCHDGTPYDEELEFVTAHGRRIWVRAIGEAVRDDAGRIVQIRGALQDITEQKQARQDIQRLAERLETTLESITDAFLTLDREWRYTYINHEAERIMGRVREDLLDRVLWEEYPDVRGTRLEHEYRRAMHDNLSVEFEYFYPRFGGWFEIHVYPSEEGVAVYFRDINERKQAREEIEFLALYDPLTRLPNRRLLLDRLQQALAAAIRDRGLGAVLFLDLDHFKTLNDTLGHDVGDRLLQAVAGRLAECLREGDTVARFGGDEFAVIAGNLGKDSDEALRHAERIGDKIRDALTRSYQLDRHERHTTVSVGITLFGEHEDSADDVMKRADLAMYQAKDAGRGTIRVFDPAMRDVMHSRMLLEAELRAGLGRGEILPHYQLQVSDDGRVIGAEALARWDHPERGLVPPADFISVAEETGLILSLGDVMLEHVCERLAAWAGDPVMGELGIAVNVSAHQFHHPDFVEHVRTIIERSRAPAQRLVLELTETLLLADIEDTVTKMSQLKGDGIRFSLDDFGTGYSSLSYLKRLPLDQIKIDREFVRDALTDENDAAIVHTIIVLARTMGLDVLAEGVESEDIRTLLLEHGCTAYQGYLFGHPVPVDEFVQEVRDRGA